MATGVRPSPSFCRYSPGGPTHSPPSRCPAPADPFTLDTDSDLSVTILRNPRNGQVRGILRDLPDPATAAAFARGPGLDVLFSRGIPGAAAWRR